MQERPNLNNLPFSQILRKYSDKITVCSIFLLRNAIKHANCVFSQIQAQGGRGWLERSERAIEESEGREERKKDGEWGVGRSGVN